MSDIFIIRQPVFDRADAIVGYELRFREGADGGDPFARSYLSGTFDDLRGGLPAYVRCSRQQLVERLFDTADARALIVLLLPELLPAADLPASAGTAMRLLALARNPDTPERELERLLSADPGLTFQLLRLVNNAATGMRGVESISHALRLVGRVAFVRWLALAFATTRRGSSGADQELVQQAVHRARFCELVGASTSRDKGALFLDRKSVV